MDTQTIDQEFDKLQGEFADVAKTVEALAEKLQAAEQAGDKNAAEWLGDLKQVAQDIDDEQTQAKVVLLALHSFIAGVAQGQQAAADDSAETTPLRSGPRASRAAAAADRVRAAAGNDDGRRHVRRLHGRQLRSLDGDGRSDGPRLEPDQQHLPLTSRDALKLEGRVAIVTGGGGSIGGAIARRLDGEGATVVVADVRRAAAEETAAHLHRGVPLELDVTDSGAWREAVERAVADQGGLDVLVNNAGTHVQALVEETADKDWDRVIRTNAYSVFYGCRAAIAPMRERGKGAIVNIVTGQFGVPYSSAYTASKFLVHGFSQCLVLEVARYGIRVNCLAPGAIPNTGFERWYREKAALLGSDYEEFLAGARNSIPLRRFGRPEEIADGVLYLASDDSAYVTGQLLGVDGGFAGYAFGLPED